MLARWLGLGERLRVREAVPSLDAAYAGCDVALVLNDPAYPDARLAAAASSGARLATNNIAPDDQSGLAAIHGWDFHGQVTAYPSLTALVRALDGGVHGAPARGRPSDAAALWRSVIDRLSAAPARRLGRRPPGRIRRAVP